MNDGYRVEIILRQRERGHRAVQSEDSATDHSRTRASPGYRRCVWCVHTRTKRPRRTASPACRLPPLLSELCPAYASLAQLPPVTGLYRYLVAGIGLCCAAVSRQLAVGKSAGHRHRAHEPRPFPWPTAMFRGPMALAGRAPSDGLGIVRPPGHLLGLPTPLYFISDPYLYRI